VQNHGQNPAGRTFDASITIAVTLTQNLWQAIPRWLSRFSHAPLYPNPLKERKRVLYAPIIESGHTIQKEQKKGLREALKALGEVWEVDYVYAKESVADAAEAWQPHYIITQFHTAASTTINEVKRLKAACMGYMVNWNGDVWPNQADPEMMEILRYYDLHTTVNAALLPRYAACGIKAAYWQNSYEPTLLTGQQDPPRDTDVAFLGNNYSEGRQNFARWLKALPYKTKVYGSGYPDNLAEGQSLYNYQMTGELYRSAKMAVGDNQFFEATAFCSDRTFMILAAGGCLLLQQKVDQIEKYLGLVPGVHFVEWNTLDDLKEKIAYYLEHEDERARIAAAGTEEARKNHTFTKRIDELKELLKTVPRTKPTISAMMIVRNEEKNISACLNQLEWADEIVIVDTGSDDLTHFNLSTGDFDIKHAPTSHPEGAEVVDPSLLFRRGNLSVYQYTWADDFSAARNFAKSKCTSDWVFFIDADERLPEDTVRRLKEFDTWTFRKLGVTNPGAFRFLVTDIRDGVRGQAGFQTRMFKNLPDIEFRETLHESVDPSAKAIGITTVAQSVLQIDHLGSSDTTTIERKQRRNLRILDAMKPSPWVSYQKAASYAAMERWGDAVVWGEVAEAESTDPEFKGFLAFLVGYAFYKMGFKDLALRKFQTTEFPDALYLRAELEPGFHPDLYHQFLKSPTPTLFPSYSLLWKAEAHERLVEWHREELEALTA
jgi:glycosyltransferase involved in cell wall biosynthesis